VSGKLDVKDGELHNSGIGSLGIVIDSSSTLLVDVAALKLDGGGKLALNGGTITGQAASAGNELENVDNTIVGTGTISPVSTTRRLVGDTQLGKSRWKIRNSASRCAPRSARRSLLRRPRRPWKTRHLRHQRSWCHQGSSHRLCRSRKRQISRRQKRRYPQRQSHRLNWFRRNWKSRHCCRR